MPFSPDWRLDALWIQAACNEVLTSQDKRYLEFILRQLHRSPDARRVFDEVCSVLSTQNNLTELELIHALSGDPRWVVSVQCVIWPARRYALIGLSV
jgi:hypothetical protein